MRNPEYNQYRHIYAMKSGKPSRQVSRTNRLIKPLYDFLDFVDLAPVFLLVDLATLVFPEALR